MLMLAFNPKTANKNALLNECCFLYLHRSEVRRCSVLWSMEAVRWRPSVLFWGHRSSFQVEGPDFTTVHQSSIQGARCWDREGERKINTGLKKKTLFMNSPKPWKADSVSWLAVLQEAMGWTMTMARLCLPAYTVLLVGCFHTAVTENDVTPRLTFSYSKFFFINFLHDTAVKHYYLKYASPITKHLLLTGLFRATEGWRVRCSTLWFSFVWSFFVKSSSWQTVNKQSGLLLPPTLCVVKMIQSHKWKQESLFC